MRKYFATLAVMLGLCVGASVAIAQVEWVTKEVKWAHTRQGSPTGAGDIYQRDTTFNVIAASQTDTTHVFTLEHLSSNLLGRGPRATAAVGDTLILGYLVIAQDSAGATASTVSVAGVLIDGTIDNVSGVTAGNRGNWKQLDSLVIRQSPYNPDDTGPLVIPIRAAYTTMDNYDPGGVIESPKPKYLAFGFDKFRARITGVTGVMTAARVFVRYPKNISGQGSRAN